MESFFVCFPCLLRIVKLDQHDIKSGPGFSVLRIELSGHPRIVMYFVTAPHHEVCGRPTCSIISTREINMDGPGMEIDRRSILLGVHRFFSLPVGLFRFCLIVRVFRHFHFTREDFDLLRNDLNIIELEIPHDDGRQDLIGKANHRCVWTSIRLSC